MNERVKIVARQALELFKGTLPRGYSIGIETYQEFFEKLPEFQEPKWIKWADGRPKEAQPIYLVSENGDIATALFSQEHHIRYDSPWTHWMPRFMPEPPQEEESPCVKELLVERSRQPNAGGKYAIDCAIKIVKEFESKGK
jgi:hypothetical protein